MKNDDETSHRNNIRSLKQVIEESNTGHSEVLNTLASLTVSLYAMADFLELANVDKSIKGPLVKNLRGIANRLNMVATNGTVKFDSEASQVVKELSIGLRDARLRDDEIKWKVRANELLRRNKENTND